MLFVHARGESLPANHIGCGECVYPPAGTATAALRASGDYDPWSRPDPRRDFILSLAFAQQRGNAVMLRQASARRLRNRAGGRHATGARA